jgi:hypothetical protein
MNLDGLGGARGCSDWVEVLVLLGIADAPICPLPRPVSSSPQTALCMYPAEHCGDITHLPALCFVYRPRLHLPASSCLRVYNVANSTLVVASF